MKISHRYPVNAAGNDIDRAWLVDQLPTAKRPNALLEIALSPLPVIRIAAQTWVHVDTLISFVLGDDDLTPFELGSLSGALDVMHAGDMSDYLSEEELSEDPDFEAGFDVDAVLNGCDGADLAAPLIRQLLTRTPHRSVRPLRSVSGTTCKTTKSVLTTTASRVRAASPAADGSTEPPPYKHRTPEDCTSSGVCYIGGSFNIFQHTRVYIRRKCQHLPAYAPIYARNTSFYQHTRPIYRRKFSIF